MEKKKSAVLFQIVIFMIQFSGLVAAVILEYFSSRKMGVARYLVYKKSEFEASYFTPEWITIYTWILVAGAIVCFLLMFYLLKNGKKFTEVEIAIILHGVVFFLLYNKPQLDAYYFYVIAVMIAIAIQYIKVIYSLKKSKKGTVPPTL